MPRLRLFLAWVAMLPAAWPAAAATSPLEGLDGFVSRVMATWQVPGMAVAAVRGDTPVLVATYGFRDAEGTRPVTPHTLFALGSIAKSLTVAGLGLLVDEGRLDWDTPVRTYLPDFRLMDPRASARITPRDMVTHRSGLPRHDVLWYADAFSRAEMVRRLRFLKPTRDLGTTFQYQNLMVMAAGYLAGRLVGTSWEDFTRRRLLDPLGMRHSYLSVARFRAAPDRALPYFLGDAGRVPTPLRNTHEMAPAAGLYADVTDMVRYLRFHMGKGALGSRRLLSRAAAEAMQTPVIAVPDRPGNVPYGEPGGTSYGMGFFVTTYRGRKFVYHPGVIDGYKAVLSFMPDDGLGVVVMSNLSGANQAPTIVARNLYDRLLGLAPLPWSRRIREAERRRAAEDVAASAEAPNPLPGTRPTHPLAAYAGIYEHPAYGRIRIARTGSGLAGRFHRIAFALRHLTGDVWEVLETAWPLRKGLRLAFRTDAAGRVERLETPLADGPSYPYKVGDVTFRRVADAPAGR